ncbi:hypothetical protein ScPMuIL_001254 [Solemya velum]
MDDLPLCQEVSSLSRRVQNMKTEDVKSEDVKLKDKDAAGSKSNKNVVQNGDIIHRPQYPIVELREHMGTNIFSLTDFEEIRSVEVKPDDIWVVSFPRSGTTLTQEIVYLISRNLDFENAKSEPLESRFPFLDLIDIRAPMFSGPSQIKNMASPKLVKSHLHLHIMPSGVREKTGKIVYVARNPRDVIVSNYFFTKDLRTNVPELSMEEYLQAFISETTYASPWWQHVKDYWKQRNDPNVLFILYEDLVENTDEIVRTIASFLGKDLSDEEVLKIVEHCSFENMKNNSAVNGLSDTIPIGQQLRRGKIGSWKEHFTEDMNRLVDIMVKNTLGDTDLVFRYEAKHQ